MTSNVQTLLRHARLGWRLDLPVDFGVIGSSGPGTGDAALGGYGPGTPGNVEATAGGTFGAVSLAMFSGNPTNSSPGVALGGFFDVHLSRVHDAGQVTINDCDLINEPAEGCSRMTVTSNSSPNLSQLAGTIFTTVGSTLYWYDGTSWQLPQLGTTLARVTKAQVTRQGSLLHFTWRAQPHGIVGFTLWAGRDELARRVIPVHSASPYAVAVRSARPGPYSIHVLETGGGVRVQHVP